MSSTFRRLALAPLAAALTLLVAPPASASPAPATPPPVDDQAPPPTLAPDNPFGDPSTLPDDGFDQLPDPAVEVVERWAITPVGANDPNNVGNRPELSYTGEPGEVIEDAVTVFNLGNVTINFDLYATDAINDDQGFFNLLTGEETPTDVGTWVTLASNTLTVDPGMAATVPITITIPDDATAGDHVGGVVAGNPTQGVTDDGSFLDIDRRTSTRLYVRVGGAIRPELAIENLSTSYQPAANPLSGTATISYRIQNRGNVRLGGSYQFEVAGPFGLGRSVGDVVAFPELLPGQGIDVSAEVDGVPGLVLTFSKVTVTPTGGEAVAAGTPSASAIGLAIPVTLILLGLLAHTGWYARRRYVRRRDGDDESDYEIIDLADLREPQPT